MMSNHYLTLEDVLGIHQDSVDAFGGSEGIRDSGGLEAAVMRPQSGYYPDMVSEAAALWESLSQNHPFIDGNKRTAIASMASHLGINGYWLKVDQLEAHRFMMELYASGRFRMLELEAWLRACPTTTTTTRP